MALSTTCTPQRESPKASFYRAAEVEIKRLCSEPKILTVQLPPTKERNLRSFVSCVDKALCNSTSGLLVRLASLSYLPAGAESARNIGNSTSIGGGVRRSNALDGTVFCPRPELKKNARDGKDEKYLVLTPENFDSKVFWGTETDFLSAVIAPEEHELPPCQVVDEGQDEGINDENSQRLSNGSIAAPDTRYFRSMVDTINNGICNSKSLALGLSSTESAQSSEVVARAKSSKLDASLRAVDAANKFGDGSEFESGGDDSPATSPSTAGELAWFSDNHDRGGDSYGFCRDLVQSLAEGVLLPVVSMLSSRSSSVVTELDGEIYGGENGETSDNYDTAGDGDGDHDATTCSADYADSSGGSTDDDFSSGYGSFALPVEGASNDGGEKGRIGGNHGSGLRDERSRNNNGVYTSVGLASSRIRRPASRRMPAVNQQHSQPRATEPGGSRVTEFTRFGGRREVRRRVPSPAVASKPALSREVAAVKIGGRCMTTEKPVEANEEGLGDKKQKPEIKTKKDLSTTSDTARMIAKSHDPKKLTPTNPSAKKAHTITSTKPHKKLQQRRQPRRRQQRQLQQRQLQQQRSVRPVKHDQPRQPRFQLEGLLKTKVTSRTPKLATTTLESLCSESTASGGAGTGSSGDEWSGGSGGGGIGSSRLAEYDGAASGGGRLISSDRPPPRVSTSGHMAWERTLRTACQNPPQKTKKSTHGKTGARRPRVRGAGKVSGGGSDEASGRPSIGTQLEKQAHVRMLMEMLGKSEEDMDWLVKAKHGQGVQKSQKEQESAETEYHRLLCEVAMQQAGLKLLGDRRLEMALKTVATSGTELDRVTELLETLGEKERSLIAQAELAEHQESKEVEAASAQAEAAAASAAATSPADDTEWHYDGTVAGPTAEALAAALVATEAAEAAAAAAVAARASRSVEKERLEQAKREAEEKLDQVLEDIGVGKDKLWKLGAVLKKECREVPGGGGSALETAVGIVSDVHSARDLIAPARAKGGLRCLEDEIKAQAETLDKTRTDSQAALERMEKWRERKEALPEYQQVVADKEKAWFERERAANEQALRHIRTLLPVGVAGLTLAQLEQRAVDAGSLYPRALSLRLKDNRLLHWAVMHPDDIARSNFLRGDHAHYFTNLDQYDLVELRAVLACLPAKFEVDGDGRKAAWRATFLQRVQGLVGQERGDTVSGGWDPELQARREVQLPKLTSEQARRKEYFYPTAAELENKLGKLRERQQRLEAKQTKLAQVKDELLPEAKEEYANVLEDTRHPANKEAFKPEDLRRARDEAKVEVDRLSKELRRLEGDVASAQRALRESPYTVESLQAEAEATRRLLAERSRKARDLAKQQKEKEAADNVAAAASTIGTLGAEQAASAAASVMEPSETAGDADVVAGLDDAAEASEDLGAAPAQNQDNEDEEAEEVEVEEGLEVEGGFEADPELKSRFADKSSSLRFVTAEEDARMRKEELVSVFAVRNKAVSAGAEQDNENEEGVEEPNAGLPAIREVSGEGQSCSKGQEDHRRIDGGPVDGDSGPAGAGLEDAGLIGRGDAKGRMKAFGAILEKTLSQSLLGRAPPSGSVPVAAASAGVGAGAVAGGMVRVMMSLPRQQQSETKPAAILTPPCKPKSKFFRSIQSPAATAQSDDNSDGTVGETGRSLVPPPPAPMMGLLSQIRARAQGAVGNGGGGCQETKLGKGGLLAQIRAAEGAGACGGSDFDGETGASSADGKGERTGIAQPTLLQAPALPVPLRSLFAVVGSTTAPAAVRGPPPDFFAQLRAKAEEKQALRLATAAGT